MADLCGYLTRPIRSRISCYFYGFFRRPQQAHDRALDSGIASLSEDSGWLGRPGASSLGIDRNFEVPGRLLSPVVAVSDCPVALALQPKWGNWHYFRSHGLVLGPKP